MLVKPKDMRRFWTFSRANRVFSDSEFALVYRMTRKTFEKLLELVNHRLKKNEEMAKRAGRDTISPEATAAWHILKLIEVHYIKCSKRRAMY